MAVVVGGLVALITNRAARSMNPQTGIVGVSLAQVVLELVLKEYGCLKALNAGSC